MSKTRKIIFGISITLLCLCLLVFVVDTFLPLEITNDIIRARLLFICMCIFPVAVLGLFAKMYSWDELSVRNILKLAITFFFAFLFSPIFLFPLFGSSICEWTESEFFFNHKHKQNTKIVGRSLNCGAYDSSYSEYNPYKITKLSDNFIWAVKIDTNNLDMNKWTRAVKSDTINEWTSF